MNSEQEQLFEAFLKEHGDKRIIAANGQIYELLEKMLAYGWNNAAKECCGCLGFEEIPKSV